jgi:biotin operon repressor
MSQLKAPNGKPSNLTPEQWKLVRTPQFKAWFGDWENDPKNSSKVVDENGEPMVVFRGSKSKNPNYIPHKHELSNGIYFSTKKDVAELYTKSFWQNWVGRIFECFLNIRNIESYDTLKLKSNIYQADFEFYNKLVIESKKNNFDGICWDNFIDVPDLQVIFPKEPEDYMAKTFIVFEPTQIKLADGSNTTFEGNNPDIRFAEGGEVPFNIHREFNEYADKLPKFGYHGTQSSTLINPRPSKDGRYGEGFYLTLDPDTAEYFGRFTKTSQGYSKENESANVFEFDLRGLNLKYYKKAEDMPYIDFDGLSQKNYDGIYFYNEGEIVIFNIHKLPKGKLVHSLDRSIFDSNNPDIRFAEGGKTKRYMKKIKRGGITYGKSHAEGGIPVKNQSTGDMLEVEGGEGIVNKRSMASKSKVKLNGKDLTICQAVSELNQMEGGVQFSCEDVSDRQFIRAMAKGGELDRGTRTEQEHIQVLKDLYAKRITPKQASERIAKDHLKEDSRYYSKLAKMEGKMADGGRIGREETQENNFGVSYKLGDKFILNGVMSSKQGIETSITEILSSGLFFKVDKSSNTFSIKTLHSKGSSLTSGQYLVPLSKMEGEMAKGGKVKNDYNVPSTEDLVDMVANAREKQIKKVKQSGVPIVIGRNDGYYFKTSDSPNYSEEILSSRPSKRKVIEIIESNPNITEVYFQGSIRGGDYIGDVDFDIVDDFAVLLWKKPIDINNAIGTTFQWTMVEQDPKNEEKEIKVDSRIYMLVEQEDALIYKDRPTDDKYFYLNSYLEKNGEQSAIRIPKSDFQNLIEEGGLETIEVSQALKEQLLKPMKIYAKGGKMADGGKTRKNAKTTLKEAVGFDIDSIDISKL